MSLEAGVFPTGRPNVSASANVQNVNDALTVNTDGLASVDFGLPALNGATVTFERYDGTTWIATKAKPAGTSGLPMTNTTTATGTYNVNLGGSKQVRARVSIAGSAAFTVTANATIAVRHLGVTQDVAADLQVTSTPAAATLAPHSGSITAGGTAQQLMPANSARKGWRIQNTSGGDLWFKDVGSTGTDASVAGADCFKVGAGGYYETPVGGASQGIVSIYGATTAQTFSASEW